MHLRLCNLGTAADAPAPAARIQAAVEEHYERLCRNIAGMVYHTRGPLRRDEAADLVHEVLNETVRRALSQADHYDPSRSAKCWLMGIAARVLAGWCRQSIRDRRQLPESKLSVETWQAALESLCTVTTDESRAEQLDLRQALARLDEASRKTLELRFYRGLDGEELAQALGAPTVGAARVRVCRALQALRKLFGPADTEVTP